MEATENGWMKVKTVRQVDLLCMMPYPNIRAVLVTVYWHRSVTTDVARNPLSRVNRLGKCVSHLKVKLQSTSFQFCQHFILKSLIQFWSEVILPVSHHALPEERCFALVALYRVTCSIFLHFTESALFSNSSDEIVWQRLVKEIGNLSNMRKEILAKRKS